MGAVIQTKSEINSSYQEYSTKREIKDWGGGEKSQQNSLIQKYHVISF